MINDTKLLTEIAKAIQDLRAETGMTIKELAHKSGVPRGTLHDAIHGRWMPSIPTLYRIAEACNASVIDLLPAMGDVHRAG